MSSFTETITSKFTDLANEEITKIYAVFISKIIDEHDIKKELLTSIWKDTNNSISELIKNDIEKNTKKKQNEVNRYHENINKEKGPFCSRKADKPKSKPCGQYCKNHEEIEGQYYCDKHRKQMTKPYRCEFIDDTQCNHRLNEDEKNVFHPTEGYESEYDGKTLCKSHFNRVKRDMDKTVNRCTHTFTKKSSPNYGKRCESIAKENGRCSKHKLTEKEINEEKKKKEEESKKADDKEEIKKDEKKTGDKKEEVKKDKKEIKKDNKEEKDSKKKEDNKGDDKEKVKKDKLSSKEKKILGHKDQVIVDNVFDKKREEFIYKKHDEMIIHIDKHSGIVCINEEKENEIGERSKLSVVGIWDNKKQTYSKVLQKHVKEHVKVLGLSMENDDEDENEEEADENNEEENEEEDE